MPEILEYRTCIICGLETLASYFGDGITAPLTTCRSCLEKETKKENQQENFINFREGKS